MKKFFYLLIPILTFFCFQTVNAASLTPLWVESTVTNDYNPQSIDFDNAFRNSGRGYIIGNVSISRPNNKPAVVTSIYLHSDTWYSCEIINTTQKSFQQTDGSYVDFDVYSLKCPVIMGSNGLDYMSITYQNTQQVTAFIKGMWSFVSEEYTNEQLNTIISILQDSSSTNEITSKLDEVNKSITDSNKKIDEVNSSINNSNTDSSQSKLEDVNNNFKEDISTSPVSDLITLPLKLLTAFNNKLASTKFCQPIDMGTIFGIHWLQLPCINPSKYLGSVLWSTIDMISTALLLWAIAHKMVKVYISVTSIDGQFTSKVVTQTGGML